MHADNHQEDHSNLQANKREVTTVGQVGGACSSVTLSLLSARAEARAVSIDRIAFIAFITSR
jgi:hypothetical protein